MVASRTKFRHQNGVLNEIHNVCTKLIEYLLVFVFLAVRSKEIQKSKT